MNAKQVAFYFFMYKQSIQSNTNTQLHHYNK